MYVLVVCDRCTDKYCFHEILYYDYTISECHAAHVLLFLSVFFSYYARPGLTSLN